MSHWHKTGINRTTNTANPDRAPNGGKLTEDQAWRELRETQASLVGIVQANAGRLTPSSLRACYESQTKTDLFAKLEKIYNSLPDLQRKEQDVRNFQHRIVSMCSIGRPTAY